MEYNRDFADMSIGLPVAVCLYLCTEHFFVGKLRQDDWDGKRQE